MKRKKKKQMYVVFIALIFMICIGYAALAANLKINGTSRISNVEWDVHFENVEATENSNVTPTVAPNAPAESKLTEISYDVSFNEPGEIYEFTVDVKNAGTIDAMVESIETKLKVGDAEEEVLTGSNLPSYLNYSVTYADDVEIQNNHLLASNTSEKIKVRVEFKRDITNDELAEAANKVIKFTLSLNYKQADENAVESHPEPTNYVVTEATMQIGQTLPTGVTLTTAANAMASWADITGVTNDTNPVYLKQELNGNNIVSSYVCFQIDGNETCLQGGGATKNIEQTQQEGYDVYNNDSPYFLVNAKKIYDAFEGEGCRSDSTKITTPYSSSYTPNPTSEFHCGVSGLNAGSGAGGGVEVYYDIYHCVVSVDGSSYCFQANE